MSAVVEDLPRGFRWVLRDTWTEATRHLRAMPRNADVMVFALAQPVMFVLLFNYVFGGSVSVPGYRYVQYLLPGIFAQTVVFNSSFTSIGVAEDMQKGFIDRLRTLPIAQSAVLTGRTVSDTARGVLTFVVMLGIAFAIGFRFEGGLWRGLLATLMLLGFSYSLCWVQASIGLVVKSVEAANSAGFVWMFPMTFVSSAFVDTRSMPKALRYVADANPFTTATNAARALYNGRDPGSTIWQTVAWSVGITLVFGFLAVRRFRSFARR
ncbi:MAG: ABC transporter permease [Ilumatobacteraceae bacterium]